MDPRHNATDISISRSPHVIIQFAKFTRTAAPNTYHLDAKTNSCGTICQDT